MYFSIVTTIPSMVYYNLRSLMILVNNVKYMVNLHPIFSYFTFQSSSYCKYSETIHKFIPILIILPQMLVKLFLRNVIIIFKVRTNFLRHDPFISFRAFRNFSHCQEELLTTCDNDFNKKYIR